tara:strand:+ start:1585 stop:2901 length:1317 start_codon:yes stop_codon:yes gene_type:complete
VKLYYRVFFIALFVKLLLAAILPITSDESYYWVWSLHPQLNYYDHPAMVSWLFYFGRLFDGLGAASRWPGVLMSHGTLFFWTLIFRRHLNWKEKQCLLWLGLALLNPLFGAGALIITPDIPLLFFWSLGVFGFLEMLEKPSWKTSLVFGIALGLGLISKYMIALLPLSLIVASLVKWRWWKKIGIFLPVIFLGFFLGALPFFIWNLQNDWISVKFQLDHGFKSTPWKPNWTVEYIALQVGLIFPPLFYLAIKGIRKSPVWLTSLAFVPLIFFLFTSFSGYVEANWPIVSYPAIFALTVQAGGKRIQKWTKLFWAVIVLIVFGLVITQYSPFKKPIKTREFFEFQDLYSSIEKYEPLYARSYQMASRLSFEKKKMIYKLRGLNRRDAYDFWPGSLPSSHFYLIVESHEDLTKEYKDQGFRVLSSQPLSEKFKVLEIGKQ